jgi:hypothetical protein
MSGQKDSCSTCRYHDCGVCDKMSQSDEKDAVFVDVHVADDHGLSVYVKTHPDFCCSMFEKREQ